MTYFTSISPTELEQRNIAVKEAAIERKERCDKIMAMYAKPIEQQLFKPYAKLTGKELAYFQRMGCIVTIINPKKPADTQQSLF